MRFECGSNGIFGRAKVQVAYKNLLHGYLLHLTAGFTEAEQESLDQVLRGDQTHFEYSTIEDRIRMSDTSYSLEILCRRQVRVYYPLDRGEILLRADLDWDRDILPSTVDPEGNYAEFVIETNRPFFYVKPHLRTGSDVVPGTESDVIPAAGGNYLVLTVADGTRDIYPFFSEAEQGEIFELIRFRSKILDREHSLRVYLPPGYDENPLRAYPVLYMQDGANLFFPEEAFLGREWGRG